METVMPACLTLLASVALCAAVALSFLYYRSLKVLSGILGQSHREMLGALVAKEVNDPRVGFAAVNHLLRPVPPEPIPTTPPEPGSSVTERVLLTG